jgi:hypothetical protein
VLKVHVFIKQLAFLRRPISFIDVMLTAQTFIERGHESRAFRAQDGVKNCRACQGGEA